MIRRFPANWWLYLGLFLATCALYAPVRHFDFVNYDDPEYVTRNLHVRGGITAPGLAWAFTSREASNWFPLTWLSHMLDCQWFGLRSGWHHVTSVMLHALAALLLFAFLHRATRARWRSVLVAALFALHPLHVESVAWIAERKDVLSACFWFLTLWAYVRYAERPQPRRYWLVIVCFCLGLMAKPMIVTLPILLLLLDAWPLRRSPALREKLPLFALSAAAAVITYVAQQGGGAVKSFDAVPLWLRVQNALVSYAVYIVKVVWPSRLAVFYPYPARWPGWQVACSAVLLLAVSVLVLRSWRAHPYLAVGWLWYLVTLAPVIGLVQVGAQSRADRYTYVPMVGLSILLAWLAGDLVLCWPRMKPAVIGILAAGCACAAVSARVQLQYWSNSQSLFQHALDVTRSNYVAHHNLGNALADIRGRLPDAIAHLQTAVRLKPDSAEAHSDLGTALAKIPGRLGDAIAEYEAAVRLAPGWETPHNNLGYGLARMPDRLPQAIAEYQAALRIKPDYAEAHNNLGVALSEVPGRLPEAVGEFQAALRIQPAYAEAHNNLGLALSRMPGRLTDAIAEFETAVRLQPDFAAAHNNLANALAETPGRLPEAIAQYQEALRLEPDFAQTHYNLGAALSKIGRTSEAMAQFEAALRIRPDYAEAHNSLGIALAGTPGRVSEAIAHFQEAVRLQPQSAEAHYNLGVTFSRIPGRMPEALAQLDIALRLRPDPKLQAIVDGMRTGRR